MAKKIKKYKVGIDSETYAISLVESPAIESDFVALAKEEEEKQQVFLESNEKHMVYGAALIPDKDIYRNNGEQEFYINFTKESIERMSQDFMKEYRQYEVKTDHDDIANEVCVVESWLVSDSYKDKSNALGINAPEGTWMVGMKVNNIETWERIKAGELKGFSVESMISLEEFGKQNDNNMNIETNDMGFWNKMKEVLAEVFSKKEGDIEPIDMEDLAANSGFTNVEDYKKEVEAIKAELEEQNAAEPAVEPTVEPTVEEPKPAEEPKVEEPAVEEPKVEEPKDNHLEELVNSLKDEIKALKDMNGTLQKKIKDLGKTPSAEPIKPNAKPSNGDTYTAWREQMRQMIG
mgnify:CR=1 FL=1